MTRSDRQHLLAEKAFLSTRLAELPQNARLTRMSVTKQLVRLEEDLSTLQDEREPARVRLTFNGRPVVGTHGIFADFGMKAVTSFTDTVATIAASLTLSAPLAQMGPIPNREQNQLLIIGPALGSYGFELEEFRGQMALDDLSPVAQALERTQNLLRATLGTDEELADSASETDPRALEKMRTFLSTLVENEAICTMEYHNQSARFTDVGEVRTSLARLGHDNLQEEDKQLVGAFEGVLPNGRTFEFRISDTREVIRGKILPSVQELDAMNDHRHQPVTISVTTTRVGSGRPRYVLKQMPTWS
jgi:hypothetical protein